MRIPLDQAILDQLSAFLADEISLDEFKDWLVDATWHLTPDDESSAARLAIRIKHRLAEHSSGYISDDALRQVLRPYSPQPVARA
ncbi:MAG: hypothetical protein ACRDJW_18120 [Thermomicrobiales bacterium]